jgi:hypothetical protein
MERKGLIRSDEFNWLNCVRWPVLPMTIAHPCWNSKPTISLIVVMGASEEERVVAAILLHGLNGHFQKLSGVAGSSVHGMSGDGANASHFLG